MSEWANQPSFKFHFVIFFLSFFLFGQSNHPNTQLPKSPICFVTCYILRVFSSIYEFMHNYFPYRIHLMINDKAHNSFDSLMLNDSGFVFNSLSDYGLIDKNVLITQAKWFFIHFYFHCVFFHVFSNHLWNIVVFFSLFWSTVKINES